MKTLTINKNDANQRLDKYLTKALPNLPQSLLYKYIRKKRIKVNGKRAEIATRLEEGNTIDLYINDEFLIQPEKRYDFMGASPCLDIVYEDENLLLLDKKVGLLCHPDEHEYVDTLITRVKRYLYEKEAFDPASEQSFTPALVNRIDRNTGGIVIAAKNAATLRVLNAKMKDRELHKYYLCILIGALDEPKGTLEGYLFKDEKKNRVYVRRQPCPGAKTIRTRYRTLGYRNGLTLAEVELLTGRTHQIRAHFASIGHPLLGDGKYGVNTQNKKFGGYKKECLYSYKLQFDFQTDSEHLAYLDGQTFTVQNVWFRTAFEEGTL